MVNSLGAAAASFLLEPLRTVARAAKPVQITGIDIFPIEIPVPPEDLEAGRYARYTVFKVETDVGVRGYAFDRGRDYELLDKTIRPNLLGKDLFAIEQHIERGLSQWGGLEHALWDAIGKIAGQPVHRLLGGSKSRLKVYLTCVWRGKSDQSHVSYEEQADFAARIRNAGFKGMKIRAWRPSPTADAEACKAIRETVGPDFSIMVDRTAGLNGLWDYPTALRAGRALEKQNVYWLEEPFDRNDFSSPARLAREVEILITGGERYQGLDAYRECLVQESYDILQPDAVICGGIFMVRKIASLSRAFHRPLILHGAMGLRLAGWLQASAAIGADWQELALITPPLLPEEQWAPALKVLNSDSVFTLRDGYIEVPQGPGLGLDVDEDAVEQYRIPESRAFYPQYA